MVELVVCGMGNAKLSSSTMLPFYVYRRVGVGIARIYFTKEDCGGLGAS